MELIKEEKGHKIFKKRSGKYAVQNKDGQFVNGQAKVDVLNAAGVIKVNPPKRKEESSQEASAEASVEEAQTEAAPVEEASAEEDED